MSKGLYTFNPNIVFETVISEENGWKNIKDTGQFFLGPAFHISINLLWIIVTLQSLYQQRYWQFGR
jgi:hypothetical protein